jgi:hypothetical protein
MCETYYLQSFLLKCLKTAIDVFILVVVRLSYLLGYVPVIILMTILVLILDLIDEAIC